MTSVATAHRTNKIKVVGENRQVLGKVTTWIVSIMEQNRQNTNGPTYSYVCIHLKQHSCLFWSWNSTEPTSIELVSFKLKNWVYTTVTHAHLISYEWRKEVDQKQTTAILCVVSLDKLCTVCENVLGNIFNTCPLYFGGKKKHVTCTRC